MSETSDTAACRAKLTIQNEGLPISLFRCEKPRHHSGLHYVTFDSHPKGGMSWPDPSPVVIGRDAR